MTDRHHLNPFSASPQPPPRQSLSATVQPPYSLTRVHIAEALGLSSDSGISLDLAHRNITEIGESGAEELAMIGRENLAEDESSILRLALGFNRLTTLPMAFALLSRLRYLNLKNNNFSVFPDVLTVMPSLEILDISRNKLRRLPSQPGSLHNLRVFSLARNKLSRLPSYFTKFRHLSILRTDHNPIEWPPKSVMERSGNLDDVQAMKEWIRGIQKWMEDDGSRQHANHNHSEESFAGDNRHTNNWPRFPHKNNDFHTGSIVAPHTRSFSMDSNFSSYSLESHQGEAYDLSLSTSSLPGRPPLAIHPSTSSLKASVSPPRSRSPDSYLPSPAKSDVSAEGEEHTARGDHRHSLQKQQHARNSSFSAGGRSQVPSLFGKKSLPDLRSGKFLFPTMATTAIATPTKVPDMPDRGRPNARGAMPPMKTADEFSFPSPLSLRQDSNSSDVRPIIRPLHSFTREPAVSSNTQAPSMEVERNSYFRRLSKLPASSVSNTLPQSLLYIIDSVRSILFAVSQVYQTLLHYTVFAIDDRLSSVLKKVLDPASIDMMQLINSLDRFDTVSRKSLPSPAVCRSVIESCKDTVTVFGKAIGVLTLQLKVLETQDDVRYLRQMVLILYGATAEISHAWQTMVPHIDAVKPLLRDRRPPLAKSYVPNSPPYPSGSGSSTTQDMESPPQVMSVTYGTTTDPLRSTSVTRGASSLPVGRYQRTARRHAGSFSSRDVEIGKTLPSYEEALLPLPPQQPSLLSMFGTATENATLRVKRPPFGGPGAPPMPSTSPSAGRQSHSRQGSQTSLTASSSASSPSMYGQMPSSLEVPQTSKKLVDKQALDAMRVAVEAAPGVWDMMEKILGGVLEAQADIREVLMRAKAVTRRLRESIPAVQKGDAVADVKTMREEAHVFVKTVVQLSNLVKLHGAGHASYPALRSKMVTLTNSTEEFVILLHVSSFSSSAPRPYSPMLMGGTSAVVNSGSGLLSPPGLEESRLPPSMSRSRSAQASTNLRLRVPSPARDGPRSAMPFNNNAHYPRLGSGLPREVTVPPG